MNSIPFSILLIYVPIGELFVTVSCFLIIYLKTSTISDREYDLSANFNLSINLRADILDLLLLYDFYDFPCIVDAKI